MDKHLMLELAKELNLIIFIALKINLQLTQDYYLKRAEDDNTFPVAKESRLFCRIKRI